MGSIVVLELPIPGISQGDDKCHFTGTIQLFHWIEL